MTALDCPTCHARSGSDCIDTHKPHVARLRATELLRFELRKIGGAA